MKFSRSWTMYMKTDKQGFKAAFSKVLKFGNRLFFYNALYTYEIWEICYGSVYAGSFSIVKRSQYRNWPQKRLEGKMIEDENGLLLELYMRPGINFISLGIGAVLFSVVICYLIGYLLYVPFGGDNFFLLIAILFVLIFPTICWVLFRIQQWMSNALQEDFIAVLQEIEKQVMLSKQNSTQ